MRIFHVQNAWWATPFLLRKFNIKANDDLIGTDFGQFVKHRRFEGRGGKKILSGKTWKTTHDPWRGISRTSFGIDYLKPYRSRNGITQQDLDINEKMMELNCYDDEDNPTFGWDVYVQRLVNLYPMIDLLSLVIDLRFIELLCPVQGGSNRGSWRTRYR